MKIKIANTLRTSLFSAYFLSQNLLVSINQDIKATNAIQKRQEGNTGSDLTNNFTNFLFDFLFIFVGLFAIFVARFVLFVVFGLVLYIELPAFKGFFIFNAGQNHDQLADFPLLQPILFSKIEKLM